MSRWLSTTTRLAKQPRFVTTLKEAAKPPLEKSIPVTSPFGLDSPVLLNRKVTTSYLLSLLFSSESKERRQKQLDHEIAHSPFYESKSFRNVNGKIFTPPISWFKQEHAKFFPDFYGLTLAGPTSLFDVLGAVNLVRVYSTVSGENCCNTYFGDYMNDYESFHREHPLTNIIDINIPQNWLKGFVINLLKNHIRTTIPKERWNQYFVLPEHILPFDIRQKLLCDNMCSGYVYVLDDQGRIRWATLGYADDDEFELLWRCVRGLERVASQ